MEGDLKKNKSVPFSLRIGTRGSALALTQSEWVADLIRKHNPGADVELVTIRTQGDILKDAPLAQIGGKGVFIKEIEEALLRREVDLAVHSMKDVPAELPEGLEIVVMPLREDPRDVLISREGRKLEEMPSGAKIGTGSLRRGVQIRNRMPGLEIVPLRGNIGTRIRKLEKEVLDGVILAAAGILRMGWAAQVSQYLPVDLLVPAVGQGALGIETRQGDTRCRDAAAFLNDPVTFCEVGAERAFLKRLGGGCQLPIACFAKKNGEEIALDGLVGSLDGRTVIRRQVRGPVSEFMLLGEGLAAQILAEGGCALLEELYSKEG
jgi:hydroxymethylbilane synthase